MIMAQKQKFLVNIISGLVLILSVVSVLFSSVSAFALVSPEPEIKKVLSQGGGGIAPPDINPDFLKPLRQDLPADKTMDRLNLIFVFSDEIPDAELSDYTNFVQTTIDKTQVPDSTTERGFLQTEPIRSNRNKINLWKYTKKLSEIEYVDFQRQTHSYNNLLSIKYPVPIFIRPENLTPNPLDPYDGRTSASLPSLEYSADHKIQKYYPGTRVNFYMEGKVGSIFSKSLLPTLTHELGHAIFNLADEYSESGQTVALTRYPNCAPDIATARTWWGDLEGQTDPYIKEIFEIQNPRSIFEASIFYNPQSFTYDDYIQQFTNSYKVGYFPGGCYATTDTGQTRPLANSMMGNSYYNHFFGLVNTREINKVFALFPKSLPFGIPVNNFEFFNDTVFENVKCQTVLLENNKKNLHCEYKTKPGRTLSDSPNFSMELRKIKEEGQTNLSTSNCKVTNNTVVCDDLDVSNIDFNQKTYLVWNFGESLSTLITTNTIYDPQLGKPFEKLANFPAIDKAKPTIKITDPYTCGGKITGNVTDNLGTGNIKSVTVQLTKSGETTPKYTFNPIPDSTGNYSIAVQQTNINEATTYVESGDYKVTYFATDISDNVSLPGTYNATIKAKETCDAKPVVAVVPAPTTQTNVTKNIATIAPVLIRSGGGRLAGIVFFALFISGVSITASILNNRKKL
jgi:IgA Peptidase M64